VNNQNPSNKPITLADVGEFFKNFGGAASSLLAFAESKYPILPINSPIRERFSLVAAIFAVVAGFGADQSAKRSGRLVS
jgi:hypothetical protein